MTIPQDIIRADVLAMTSYPVPDAAGLIKLDAMENPYALPRPLADRLGERLAQVALNRYPLPRPGALLDKLKRAMQVPADCDVLLGNGSDELISLIATACAKPGAKLLAPVPGFVMYAMSAKLAHLEFVGVPLNADLTLDGSAMLEAVAVHQPAVIYLAYPNNPTGTLFDDADLERVVRAANRSLVVIDEAYQPFAQRSWMSRAGEFDNVVVMRTVSKLGLAGIRLGYLVGLPAWINELDKVRPPYNTNVLTQATVDFMLDHLEVLDAQAAELRAERARLAEAIGALPGAHVFPSAGNFLLVRVPDAAAVFDALLGARILIKNVSKMHPLLAECVRITVSTPDENAQLLAALSNVLV
ncbi:MULTISPECIES: histidinol-phosphate transaminase [Burkholderiaceae]|uniref:histidinol-phosphate transaminase n=1 Tax=Burkholderiaceae TaxID=119060 RepID=UPI00095CAF54|nr:MULTISPECIES: histidinol-phosphate transaminase [Burkholderiaceae]MCF2133384.1 histidinol-phosphate transaminase [Mycetohabitans sp. B3]MCG1018023.1 histidinol-phosphate transaminase [Mycetohabitans sp. B4]MCG1038937.1 histidinol-phosphate transaminase [Mycetohabitans sp. B7]SIT69767.1 histidinol phosphate aminotransferase apoenzyme [Burkholderia sp. b13]SIT77625.1 histidinol phosphate aminotransferase apoenzyme [Burkholderia sp. b14]